MKKKKKKMKKRDKMLVLAVICVVGYTVAAFLLQYFTSTEVSSTLTSCWYGFWAVEVWILAGITKTKIKNNHFEQAGVPEREEEV